MSYTDLVADKTTSGSIKSWLNYGKIDSEGVLEEAQAMIYQRLRVREMRASDSIPVAIGKIAVDLPDQFLDPISVRDITNNCRLHLREEEQLEDMRSWTDGVLDEGDPTYFGVYDEAFNFDVRAMSAFTIRTVFYQQPDPLSSSNGKNFLTMRYSHLLRMACLATGARFAKDDEVFAREQKLLFIEIADISVNDEMARSTYVPVEQM